MATTLNQADRELQVELRDTATNVVLTDWSITLIPPIGSPGQPAQVEIRDCLESYPSGATFTIVGNYYDSNQILLDTESATFVKP